MATAPAKRCVICNVQLNPKNKSGYCAPHWSQNSWRITRERDPDFETRRIKAVRMKYRSDPELRERVSAHCRTINKLPHAVAARKRKAHEQRLWERGNAAQPAGSPSRILAGKRVTETKLAWCPRELRDEYKHMVRYGKIPAAEAKVIILAQHERDMARFRASLRRNTEGMDG